MNEEVWKEIEGYEGFYAISTIGRVKSLSRTFIKSDGRRYTVKEKIIKPAIDKDGYLRIELNKIGDTKKYYVHRLVGLAFINNPNNKPQINHIDFDVKNNIVENLEWVTNQENIQHNVKHGRLKDQYGQDNPNVKINKEIVFKIRNLRMEGKTLDEISRLTGTSVSNVKNVIYKKTWTWLKDGMEVVK